MLGRLENSTLGDSLEKVLATSSASYCNAMITYLLDSMLIGLKCSRFCRKLDSQNEQVKLVAHFASSMLDVMPNSNLRVASISCLDSMSNNLFNYSLDLKSK